MEGIEFDQDNTGYAYNNNAKNTKDSVFAKFLVGKGIVTNEQQANAILIAIGLVCLAISLFLLISSLSNKNKIVIELPPEIIQRLPQEVQTTIRKEQAQYKK